MGRPTEVKVGHRFYAIRWMTDKEWLKAHPDLDDSRGCCDHTPAVIDIRTEMDGANTSEDHMREIFTHECLHAVTNMSMLWGHWENLREQTRLEWHSAEETIILGMAPLLVGMLNDNPDIVAWLLGVDEAT